jgi:hypothetical protein
MDAKPDQECCAGTTSDTPVGKSNRPGLPSIDYRVGTWHEFRESLLARLSGADFPVLSGLGTRRDDDWTIGVCDAFAVMADVLTAYQERLANESYLRTATERRSVLELARLIDYQPRPGVAADTWLAFELETVPGQPALSARPVVVPVGTRAQSVPDPDQSAQTFETTTEITARAEWNAMPAQSSERVLVWAGLRDIYLRGIATQLQVGDALLFVSADRAAGTTGLSELRWVQRVEADARRGITRVMLNEELGAKWDDSSTRGATVHALRQRASLFGHNSVLKSTIDAALEKANGS